MAGAQDSFEWNHLFHQKELIQVFSQSQSQRQSLPEISEELIDEIQYRMPVEMHQCYSFDRSLFALHAAVDCAKKMTNREIILGFSDYSSDLVTKRIPLPLQGHLDYVLAILDHILQESGDDIAAMIYEPIMHVSSSGMMLESGDLDQILLKLKQYQVILIADERMTSLYRFGFLWASDQYLCRPDIICFGNQPAFIFVNRTIALWNQSEQIFLSAHQQHVYWNWKIAQVIWRRLQQDDLSRMILSLHKMHETFCHLLMSPHVINMMCCGSVLVVHYDHSVSQYTHFFQSPEFTLSYQTVVYTPPYDATESELLMAYEKLRKIALHSAESSQNFSEKDAKLIPEKSEIPESL